MKSRIFYYDGADCTGKTTAIKSKLGLEPNNTHFISDRSPLTNLIYGQILGRKLDFKSIGNLIRSTVCNNSSEIFIFHADDKKLEDRLNKRGDDFVNLEKILKINAFYVEYLQRRIGNIFCYTKIDDIFSQIVDDEISFDYSQIVKNAIYYKNCQYSLSYNFDNINLCRGAFFKFFTKNPASQQKLDIEKYERNKVVSDLIFTAHIQNSKYSEGIESRRFISINDSCFSFVQVTHLIADNTTYFAFTLRSTHVENNLKEDFFLIDVIVQKFIAFLSERFSNENISKSSISIKITLNNAHI